MLTYCVEPSAGMKAKGVKVCQIDLNAWKEKAPSLRQTDKFPDGSVNVTVDDKEADALTDHWDNVGWAYQMV